MCEYAAPKLRTKSAMLPGLASNVLRAAAVEDPPLPAVLHHECLPRGLLGRRDLILAGVREDEEIEPPRSRSVRTVTARWHPTPRSCAAGSSLYTGMTSAMRLWMASPSAS